MAAERENSDEPVAASPSPNPPGVTTPLAKEAIFKKTLQTPYEAVFTLDSTGTYYVQPASVRGVPVSRIDVQSSYWETSWDSLDEFLARESREKELKEKYLKLKRQKPSDVPISKRAKVHQDNMSKHVKIREIFGDESPYHPNQLVSKQHLPDEGLCQKEFMYRIACKVSDLKVLHKKGLLQMDPWDFLRWRVHLQISDKVNRIGQSAKGCVRSVIGKLFDHQDGSPADPIMREAILLSALYQNRLASFKNHGKAEYTPDTSVMKYLEATMPEGSRPSRPKDLAAKPVLKQVRRQSGSAKADARKQLNLEAREERRRRLKAQAGTYQGVNAFRARRQTE
ncbi:hypothetical protein E4U42_004110 [Claviceps africana]|uniref:Uncharacterized protein n=1 Tax=Claviceps africana TaxID=83212 RepID=A0A8K0JBU6_9HYPO|nr:hypothetical protein E4U42_004110 [Claviceps africana]